MRILLFVAVVFICLTAKAQSNGGWQLQRTLQGDWVSFEVDHIGNAYLINQANQLRKYTSQGDSVAIYNDQRRYGTIGSLDVANPLLLLAYYPDYSTLVWLDRFLRPVNTLDLRASGIFSIGAVASSFDSKVWVFDKMEQRLKKVGQKGELLQQTPDLRQVLAKNMDPVSIQEAQQRVYLYDSIQGVFVFDYFGNFEKNIDVKGWADWSIQGTAMQGIKEGMLVEYDLRSGLTTTIILPSNKPFEKAQWSIDKQLYCLQPLVLSTGAQLLIYTQKHD
jgi:hypothetical protein